MERVPALTPEDVARLVPAATDIEEACRGGQKQVFPCTIRGERYVLKFLRLGMDALDSLDDGSTETIDAILARAKREVETMRKCCSPHLVRLGPMPLSHVEDQGKTFVYYAEEYIEGADVSELVKANEPFGVEELVRLGIGLTRAVEALWAERIIHRDIKPGNIRRRSSNGDYVLLDLGYAFDLRDRSLTAFGCVPGTRGYHSPEQIQFMLKRQIDFRSDLFLVGIVLYIAATRSHPFQVAPAMTVADWVDSILHHQPAPTSRYRPELPAKLSDIIMRLLAKKPHLRYRSCSGLIAELSSVTSG